MQGSAYLIHQRDVRIAAWAVCLLALGSGISLLLGFLTPVAGALAALGGLGATFMFFPAGHCCFELRRWGGDIFHGTLKIRRSNPLKEQHSIDWKAVSQLLKRHGFEQSEVEVLRKTVIAELASGY
jgi:uncharacterized membrane protein YphA (DoxX/SURF4 family)